MIALPWQYAQLFFPIRTRGANLAALEVYVTEFKTPAALNESDRTVAAQLQRFYKTLGSRPGSGVVFDEGKTITLLSHGVFMFPASRILAALGGRTRAADLAMVLTLFDYWLAQDRAGVNPVPWRVSDRYTSAQEFADRHLGVDATGFVGGYLHTHYPGAGLTAESEWPAFLQAGAVRESLGQVAPLDLLVYPHGHVAIIDEVLGAGGSSVHCWVAESKGSADGGPQYHERWISLEGGRQFRIAASSAAPAEPLQAVLHPRV